MTDATEAIPNDPNHAPGDPPATVSRKRGRSRSKAAASEPEVEATASTKATTARPKKRAKKHPKRKKRGAETTEVVKRGRGRPPYRPTSEQLRLFEVTASLVPTFTTREWCLILDIDEKTFAKYYDQYFRKPIEKGVAKGKVSSGAVLVREMMKGNMTALIWYEKTRHGYTEKVHTLVSNPEGGPVEQNVHHSGAVAIGLFLPPNGRDVPAQGQTLPKPIPLPSNNRKVPPA